MIGQSPIHNMVKDQPCLLGSNLSSLTDAKATLLEIVGAVEISPMECRWGEDSRIHPLAPENHLVIYEHIYTYCCLVPGNIATQHSYGGAMIFALFHLVSIDSSVRKHL